MINRGDIIGRLVENEMEMVQSMSLRDMDDYIKGLIAAILETKSDAELLLLDTNLLLKEQGNV